MNIFFLLTALKYFSRSLLAIESQFWIIRRFLLGYRLSVVDVPSLILIFIEKKRNNEAVLSNQWIKFRERERVCVYRALPGLIAEACFSFSQHPCIKALLVKP